MLYGQTFVESPMVSQVDGAAITAAAATSMLPAASKASLPANYFQIGRKLRIIAWGIISSLITTPGTARFDVRFGSAIVFDGLAILLDSVAAHTNVCWELVIDMTCRAIGNGTNANMMGHGRWSCADILGVPASAPKGVLSAMLPWNSAPAVGAGFDSTVTNTVDLFFTQTVTTGSIKCQQFELVLPD